jgi:hypothetical protein
MRWKVLEKIISHGKKKDLEPIGQDNIVINTPDSSLYEIKIKKIKSITIKNNENGK